MTAATAQAINRMALPAASSWDDATRSAQVVISSESDVGDGYILVHSQDAIDWPTRPIPCVLDHLRAAEAVWGVLTDMQLQTIDGVPSLVGRVVVDGPPDAEAMALPRLRNGSARFSVSAQPLTIERPVGVNDPIRITRWSIAELSLVVVGADPTAIERSTPEQTPDLPPPMETDKLQAGGDPAAEVQRSADPTPTPSPVPVPAAAQSPETETIDRAAIKRERDIMRSCLAAGLTDADAQGFIASGKPFDSVVFDILTAKAAATPAATAGAIQVTRDAGDTLDRALEATLAYQAGVETQLPDIARDYRGYRALDVARTWLESRGVNVRGLSISETVDRAFHSTSDFPLLLANVASKSLTRGYEEEPQTWKPLAVQRNLPDFKQTSEAQIQGATVPQPLGENGEYENGTLMEAAGGWKLGTYALRLPIGRNLIINDDLGALSSAPEKLGRGARLMENNLIWALLTTGTNGAAVAIDNTACFVAGHSNTGSGAIGITGIDAGITALRKQTDIAGNSLNLEAAYLVVPPELRTAALQFLYPTGYAPSSLTGASGPNPFAGAMQLIVENRLSAKSTTQYYVMANPARIDMIRYGYLSGAEGPQITSVEKRNPDGVELLVREDFGCALLDYRGFYRSTGA